MNANEFIEAVSSMGVGTKANAKKYVKESGKTEFNSFSDMIAVSRMSEKYSGHKHGYHNYGRLSGMAQDVLSCTGSPGKCEESIRKELKLQREIRLGYRDENGVKIKQQNTVKEPIPDYLLKPCNK